jgi:phosphomannomutase
MTPVGYGKIKVIMHKNRRIAFAAEHSGHYMFRDFYSADSGMLAGLVVLELVAELHARGKTISSALGGLRQRYHESGEINFRLPEGTDVPAIIARGVQMFRSEAVRLYALAPEGVLAIDSYPPSFEQPAPDVRLEAKDWWFVMRASGTEPICRLYVESVDDPAIMAVKRDALIALVGAKYRM